MLRRRPAPLLLLTAIAASVILVPWAIDGVPPGADVPQAADTKLIEQPLAGLGGGESIREISQESPFSMVALTGDDLSGTEVKVRAKHGDGNWGPWYDAESLESNLDDADRTGVSGTDPVFVGLTNTVQVSVTRPAGAPVTTAPPEDSSGELGYRPANAEHSLAQNMSAILITPPLAPVDVNFSPPVGVLAPGQPPSIISRAQWGADERLKCGGPRYDKSVRAAVIHHTAGSNDYAPEDSAAIVRAAYAYHTRTLGWCDIAYNGLVDKYGQVFEGRAGGMDRPVEGSHTGGFNTDTWGVAMIGDFQVETPTDIQIRTTGRLLGWRLGLDHVDPKGFVDLTSAGGSYTHFPRGMRPTLPAIFTHRDVGNTECPGDAAYAAMDQIREIAARFNDPPGPLTLEDRLRGGAIHTKWERMGGEASPLGSPRAPEATATGTSRYVTFTRGAIYWSPDSGPQPIGGAIYDAWASLGYERGLLGLPTSSEIHEPQWIKQNFQHGTLNFDRETGLITRVVDGVAQELPPLGPDGPPVQLERFTPILLD